MKLNDISSKPFKVITYILLTFIGSYLTTLNTEVAFISTLVCVWICMMPRLKYEEFSFKDKIPEFFVKFDLPNNVLKILPVFLTFIFCTQQSATTPVIQDSNFNFFIYFFPVIIGCLHYFIYNKYENEQDWAMPLIVSFIIVIGSQFVVGDFPEFAKNIFPFLTDSTPNIYLSWLLLLQIAIVYAVFRVLSIVIASRSVCLIIVGAIFTIFAYMQNIYSSIIGLNFKPNDVIKFKEFFALLSILHKDNIDMAKIAPAIAVIIIIGMVATLLGKNTSIYAFKIRMKSFVCGALIIAVSILAFNSLYASVSFENYNTSTGFVSYIVHNLNKKNTFSKELQDKINTEIIAMEQASAEKEENSQSEGDPNADFTVPPAQSYDPSASPTPSPNNSGNQAEDDMFADFTVPQQQTPVETEPQENDMFADFTVPAQTNSYIENQEPETQMFADFTVPQY